MADLRKAARGRECQVRIPGVCNGNSETSVLAHIRLAGLCGIGKRLQKAEGIIEGMLMALDIRLEMDIVVNNSN